MAYIDMTGTEDDDTLVAENGNDYALHGRGGNDTLVGADGNDWLLGGAGADTLIGGDGDDWFVYADDDMPADDTLDGGNGFDNIVIMSNAGEHRFLFLNDTMRTNIEQVSGRDGNEYFDASALTSGITLSGGTGNDYLEGGQGADILAGGAGDDRLIGSGGADFLFGGDGNDQIIYTAGHAYDGDFIDGGDGTDTVRFNTEAGTSLSFAVDGDRFLGIEELIGGDGNDTLDASAVSTGIALSGGAGNDVLIGGSGGSYIEGGDGDDFLVGGNGDDVLIGGNGRDFLQGNGGNHRLIGGAHDDVFIVRGNAGTWTVADFTQGVDHIWIDTAQPLDFDDVLANAVQVGDNTVITIDDSVLVLEHVALTGLQASDFWF